MARLTTVTRPELPGLPCPYCGLVTAADAEGAVSAAASWGWCGVKLTIEHQPAGLLLLRPLEDPTQARVVSLWVAPEHTGVGYGRQLVQAAAAGLIERRVRSVYARSGRGRVTCGTPPREFLRAVGFSRGLDERLWRLDLDRTVGERAGLLEAFERLMGSLRPAPPEPAGGAISGAARARH
ncbi:MAG: GNAT family N-acetyltransferase [Propionicimonas sp.]